MRDRHCKPGFISSSAHRVTSFYTRTEDFSLLSWKKAQAGREEWDWMKSRFFLSLSKYYHTKYWLASPRQSPTQQHSKQWASARAGACYLQAMGTNSAQLAPFPKAWPNAKMAVACVTDFLKDLSSARCSARRFSCQPRRPHSLSDPQLRPEGQDDGTGTPGRPHHTYAQEAIARSPTPAPRLEAHSQPQSISLWELWIHSKKPKATSLIRHKRSRTLPMV